MKKAPVLIAILPLLLLLAACGGSAKDDGRTSVVASFYPFAWIAEQVGGTQVDVQNLTSPGAEPHDLELKPKQVAAVQYADVVVYEKKFQAAVDDAVDQAGRSSKDTVDVASIVPEKRFQAGAEDDGHEQKGVDPHTWLNPADMVTITQDVEKKLASADPSNATTFRANADRLVAELTALDDSFKAGLASCQVKTIVTSHAAFQYLASRYGLVQVPIAGIDPANEPSPSQLASITKLVRQQNITTIFTEELVSPAIADTIAQETGVKTATLDPIEGLSDETKNETYLTLMAKNLATLQKANSCS